MYMYKINIISVISSTLTTSILMNTETGKKPIIPDSDGHPSVIVDVLACSCTQDMTSITATKCSNRISILKQNMEELMPKILLLS